MRVSSLAAAFMIAAGAAALQSAAAWAGPYLGYVTAYSDYGNGTVRGPVRQGPYGPQVKLPGGPWLYCRKSGLISGRHRPCSETLRRETVDFWETQTDDHGGRR